MQGFLGYIWQAKDAISRRRNYYIIDRNVRGVQIENIQKPVSKIDI